MVKLIVSGKNIDVSMFMSEIFTDTRFFPMLYNDTLDRDCLKEVQSIAEKYSVKAEIQFGKE